MLIPKPRLRALFETSVTDLQKAGVTPLPFECYWLGYLCERVINRPGHAPDFSRPCFSCGGATFYALTIGASTWLSDYPGAWWDGSETGRLDVNRDMDVLATAYAMAHSYTPDVFAALVDETHARLVIRTWASRLSCTERELCAAIRSWAGDTTDAVEVENPNEIKSVAEPSPEDWGGTLCWLSYHYKQTPQWFLWNCTDDELSLMIRRCPLGERKTYTGNDADHEALRMLKKYLTGLRANNV